MTVRRLAAIGGLAMGLLVAIGCGREFLSGPPRICRTSVSPSELPFTGGSVTVTVEVCPSAGVTRITGQLRRPDGTAVGEPVELARVRGRQWSGDLSVPGNTRTDADVEYVITVRACDKCGGETPAPGVEAGRVRVKAAPSLPEPPFRP